MTFSDFSKENRARCEAPAGFNHALASWSLSDWFTAVVGELGEAANIAKKLNRVRDGVRGNKESEPELRKKLRSELADAYIYLDLLAQREGIDLGCAVRDTFDAKSSEIGYSAPPSLVRVIAETTREGRKTEDLARVERGATTPGTGSTANPATGDK